MSSDGSLSLEEALDLLRQHASEADVNTSKVAIADPGTAAQLGATFSSTLAAHGAILAQLASNSDAPSIQQNSDALAVQVLAKAGQGQQESGAGKGADTGLAINVAAKASAVASDQGLGDLSTRGNGTEPARTPAMAVRTFAAVAPQASTSSEFAAPATTLSAPAAPPTNARVSSQEGEGGGDTKNNDGSVAVALGMQASTTLSHVETDFAALSSSLESTTTVLIQAQIDVLKTQLAEGNNALISGDTASAQSTLNNVLRASVRLDAFLKAGKKFNASFLNSLLSN